MKADEKCGNPNCITGGKPQYPEGEAVTCSPHCYDEMEEAELEAENERETARVIELMGRDFAGAADWNCIYESDERYAEILDKDDNRIGIISERRLTGYVNDAEAA